MKMKSIFFLIAFLFLVCTVRGQRSEDNDVFMVTVETPGTFDANDVPDNVTHLKIIGELDLPHDCIELYNILKRGYIELLDLEETSFKTYAESVELPVTDSWYTYTATCYVANSFPVGLFSDLSFSGKIIMPNTIKTIQKNTFYGDHTFNQNEVVFSEGLDSIGQDAFCFSKLKKISLPQSLKYLGSGCFYDNEYLEKLYLPDQLTIVEDSLITNCGKLKNLHLPNNLKRIEWWSISGKFETITIPENVEYVGYQALDGCSWLKEIHCLPVTPPACGHEPSPYYSLEPYYGNTFSNYLKQNVVLYVPKGSLEAYKEADEWKDFLDIREEIDGYEEDLSWYEEENDPSSVLQLEVQKNKDVNVYNLQGVCVKRNVKKYNWSEGLDKGIYIIDGEKRIVDR